MTTVLAFGVLASAALAWGLGILVVVVLAAGVLGTVARRNRLRRSSDAMRAEGVYRRLFDASHDAMFILNEADEIVDANEAASRLLGYDHGDLRETHPDWLGGIVADATRDAGQATTDAHNSSPLDGEARHRDGSVIPIDMTASQISEDRRLVMVRDRRRQTTESALRQSEERYRVLTEATCVIAWEVDLASFRFTYVAPQAERLLGFDRDAWYEEGFWEDHLHPDDQAWAVRYCLDESARESQYEFEYRMIASNGRTVWVKDFVSVAREENRLRGVLLDVTEQREAGIALKESEARYRTLVEHAPEAIVVMDIDLGRFIDCNPNAEALFGFEREQLLRLGPPDVSPPKQPDGTWSEQSARELVLAAFRGAATAFEWTHMARDGREFPCEVRLVRLPSSSRRLIRGSMTDISQRKQRERAARSRHKLVEGELSAARETLVRQTRLATIGQLSGSIAHELRNPLAAIRNAAYLVRRDTEETRRSEHIEIIESEVETADRIIHTLLDMTKAREPLKKRVLVKALAEATFAAIPDRSGVHLDLSSVTDQCTVDADPDQLTQVLTNLFTNSIQAVDGDGHISVDCVHEDALDTISVSDSGPGVSPEVSTRMFEALFTTKAKGTGLGLAICAQIIDRHGGRIELVDAGPGATIRLTLPRPDETMDDSEVTRLVGARSQETAGG